MDQFRISLFHHLSDVAGQGVQESFLVAEQASLANPTTHDLAQDVASAFVGWDHTIAYQECRGADVIGDDPK